MAKTRDSWDKANRQKKTWQQRGTGNGPAPIGPVLQRLKKRRAERNRQHVDSALLKQSGWRGFSISAPVTELLAVHEVDIDHLSNAIKAALASLPFHPSSMPVKFWEYNMEIEKLSKQLARLGGHFELHDFPKELDRWVCKFKRKSPPANKVESVPSIG